MSSTRSPQLLGVLIGLSPKYYVPTGEYSPSPAEETLTSTRFLLNITTKLIVSDPQGPGRSLLFRKSFSQPLDALVGGAARDTIASMLSEVHVPETLRSGSVMDKILEHGRGLAHGRPTPQTQSCVMCLDVDIKAFVDELPTPSENN